MLNSNLLVYWRIFASICIYLLVKIHCSSGLSLSDSAAATRVVAPLIVFIYHSFFYFRSSAEVFPGARSLRESWGLLQKTTGRASLVGAGSSLHKQLTTPEVPMLKCPEVERSCRDPGETVKARRCPDWSQRGEWSCQSSAAGPRSRGTVQCGENMRKTAMKKLYRLELIKLWPLDFNFGPP